MKLIRSKYEILEQGPGLEGIYQQIEIAGRTCYKSQRPEGQTAKDFVDRMIASKHYAMLEHGTVYLLFSSNPYSSSDEKFIEKYEYNPYSKVRCVGCDDDFVEINSKGEYIYTGDIWGTGVYGNTVYAITTNMRVLQENSWIDDLQYLCEPTEFHEKRVTVRFTTDIGVSREVNRHRVNSVAEQSTRYCNYSKDKFGNQITITCNNDIPTKEYLESLRKWSRGDIQSPKSAFRTMCGEIYNFKEDQFSIVDIWIFGNAACEFAYMELIKRSWTPQQARRVLPLDLCTELVHTAFVSDWGHFFDLRARGITGAPHPDAKALAEPLMEEFEIRKLI